MIDNETDLLVDVEIPADSIQLGHDKDGLPKTDPVEGKDKAPKEPKKAAPAKPDPTLEAVKKTEAELADARRRAFEAQVERDRSIKLAQQERDARQRAEQNLDTRTGQAIRAHYERIYAHHQQIEGASASAQAEAAAAEREYQSAMEAQDWARASQAQRHMAKAEAALVQLEAGKSGIEAQLDEAKRAMEAMARAMAQPRDGDQDDKRPQERRPEPKQDGPTTPEEWISQFPRGTQDWLNGHKEYVTDQKLHRKLLRFAEDWVDDNGQHTLHSSEFIAALDARFFPKAKEEEPEEAGEEEEIDVAEPAPVQAKAKSAPAAPVSRSSQPMGSRAPGAGNGKVRLSPAQQDAAYRLYPEMQPKEALKRYATNLNRLAQDGISLSVPQQ